MFFLGWIQVESVGIACFFIGENILYRFSKSLAINTLPLKAKNPRDGVSIFDATFFDEEALCGV